MAELVSFEIKKINPNWLSNFIVVIQLWQKSCTVDPDELIKEVLITKYESLNDPDFILTKNRYIVVKEA